MPDFDFITENENIIRIAFFIGVLIVMGVWETFAPRRRLTVSRALRWANNLGLAFFNSLILRLILPAAATGVALFSAEQGWGLLHYYSLPLSLSILFSIIALDFIIYLQHVLVHAVPLLWRLHRVHHADPDYDVTTGSRFHPLEILLSMLIKFATIIVLGPPVVAVILFELILNVLSMFNHGNVGLPAPIDRLLRWFIVTPDMHRVHHSIEDDETNSNFGFNLSCWDRLFGTYRDQPRAGHCGMTIGIRNLRELKQSVWISGLLCMPFIGKVSGYAINRRQWDNSDDK